MIIDNVLQRIIVKAVLVFLDGDASFDGHALLDASFPGLNSQSLGRAAYVNLKMGKLRGKDLFVHLYVLPPGDDSEPLARGADACALLFPGSATEIERIRANANSVLTVAYGRPEDLPRGLDALPHIGPARTSIVPITKSLLSAHLRLAGSGAQVRVTELNTMEEVLALEASVRGLGL